MVIRSSPPCLKTAAGAGPAVVSALSSLNGLVALAVRIWGGEAPGSSALPARRSSERRTWGRRWPAVRGRLGGAGRGGRRSRLVGAGWPAVSRRRPGMRPRRPGRGAAGRHVAEGADGGAPTRHRARRAATRRRDRRRGQPPAAAARTPSPPDEESAAMPPTRTRRAHARSPASGRGPRASVAEPGRRPAAPPRRPGAVTASASRAQLRRAGRRPRCPAPRIRVPGWCAPCSGVPSRGAAGAAARRVRAPGDAGCRCGLGWGCRAGCTGLGDGSGLAGRVGLGRWLGGQLAHLAEWQPDLVRVRRWQELASAGAGAAPLAG